MQRLSQDTYNTYNKYNAFTYNAYMYTTEFSPDIPIA